MNRDVDFFNTCAENWDSIRNTNPQTLERLMGLAKIPANATILDVGSGTGVLLPYLHAAVGAQGKITAVAVGVRWEDRRKAAARMLRKR